jgi:decaprenylphospho-beta-D-erythro-pentofuranosid-2-ulose 2-reductase
VSSGDGRGVLLIGGTSEIGLAIIRRLTEQVNTAPVKPLLLGRDQEALEAALADLQASGCRGGSVELLDAEHPEDHGSALARAFQRAGSVQIAIVAVGVLGGQAGLDAQDEELLRVMRVNFLGAGSLLMHTLRQLRMQGHGTLIVLSSVAAERPRAGNAVYGASKAGLDALAQGLADAESGSGVRVLVVRPGFVLTRMTAGLRRPPFATTPEAVAEATVKALEGNAHTAWAPGILRYVFIILRHLPRPLFRKLAL